MTSLPPTAFRLTSSRVYSSSPPRRMNAAEIKQIVRLRANTEGVAIADAAIDKISEHGVRISLRYCLQLLTPSR